MNTVNNFTQNIENTMLETKIQGINEKNIPATTININDNMLMSSTKSLEMLFKIRKKYKSDMTIKKKEDLNKIKEEIEENNSKRGKNFSFQKLFQEKILKILQHPGFKIISILLTLYILFAEDLKLIFTDVTSDSIFSYISILVMIFSLIEIFLFKVAFPDYFSFDFYFWIDVLGLMSIILDLHWISEFIAQDFSDGFQIDLDPKSKAIRRFVRGIRTISRAIKMIRLIKLLKLFKINKTYSKNVNEKELNEDNKIIYGSKVGQKLEELTLKRLSILIFIMSIGIIMFNPSYYYSSKSSIKSGLQILTELKSKKAIFNATLDIFIEENSENKTDTPIMYFRAFDSEFSYTKDPSYLRLIEKIEIWEGCEFDEVTDINKKTFLCDFHAIFDNRINVKFISIMNIIKTIFLLIVITISITCFYRDTGYIVLKPLEKITNRIKNLSKNPIAAIQENFEEDSRSTEVVGNSSNYKQKNKSEVSLETIILEKTISKISTLLVLGFGEAGAEIISTNMQQASDGDINPIIPGKKVMAIYGFCDIRCFTDTTEILQEQVMIFVNEVAEIVHEITSDYCGSANKNIGDAFLLVWKFDEKFVIDNNGDLKLQRNTVTTQLVDMALIAIIKILCNVHKSYKLAKYRKHEALLKKFPNYSVKLGFGLHLGYSIEGAIGSMFKIDASYLSPNVDMASKLEEKTKLYGVKLVLSGEFVNYLSEDAKKFVRQIDVIKRENENSSNLDLDSLPVEIEDGKENYDRDLNQKIEDIKFKREKRKMLLNDIRIGKKQKMWNDFIEESEDWKVIRRKYSQEFYDNYNIAVIQFYKKNWNEAYEHFLKANMIIQDDVPTSRYLENLKNVLTKKF